MKTSVNYISSIMLGEKHICEAPKCFSVDAVISKYFNTEKIKTTVIQEGKPGYIVCQEEILLPDTEDPCDYTLNLLHEVGHSTGEKWRLNRESYKYAITNKRYALIEEFICEIFAQTLAYDMNMFPDRELEQQRDSFLVVHDIELLQIEKDYIRTKAEEIIDFIFFYS